LLRSFPHLVVVTGSQGSNPLDRYAWPLIEKYPHFNANLWLSQSLVYGHLERALAWLAQVLNGSE
jgi:hypothetical protein